MQASCLGRSTVASPLTAWSRSGAPHAARASSRPIARVRAEGPSADAPEKPSTSVPDQQEPEPLWARNEGKKKEAEGVPFGVYLIASVLVAIAAVGSVFEITAQHALFGVIPPENPLWLPILGFFAATGLPTSGFLFYRAITKANEAADRMDRFDGV